MGKSLGGGQDQGFLQHSNRLSTGSEPPSEKQGNAVLGVPINMYCNSLYIGEKIL